MLKKNPSWKHYPRRHFIGILQLRLFHPKMPPNVRKEKMPPEHLRRIIKVSKNTHPSFMGAMKYMPYALHNLLKSIPMPWESVKYVDVLYHVSGLITFVTEQRKVDMSDYRKRWSSVSERFNHEVKKRGFIRELKYPIFDDDDEVVDYGSIIGLPVPKAIECRKEGNVVFREAEEGYMFGWKAFSISKAVGVQIDNGPYIPERAGREVMVMGREVGHERVAYPYLYNPNVSLSVLEKQKLRFESGMGSKVVRNGEAIKSCCLSENSRRRKMRHAVDIPLLKAFYLQEQPDSGPRLRILLKNYTKNMEKPVRRKGPTRILRELKNTRFFQRTEIDWVEAGLQLIYQGHRMLSEVLRRKKLSYLVLDGNFNLKPLRPLTTKERKKSRVGTSYHLTREMLKLIKHIVDVHVLFRQGNVDSYELMNNIRYILNNVGVLTGIYRYKYKLMKQIKQCKALKKLSEHINVNTWAEEWRIWVFMLRGHIPLLSTYIAGLVMRMAEGRKYNPKLLSKQRSESGYDIALKRRIAAEVSSILQPVQIKKLLQHFSEAWRCWKANIPYHIVYEQAKAMELSEGRKGSMEANITKLTLGSNATSPMMSLIDKGRVARQTFVLTQSSTCFSMELADGEEMEKIKHQTELIELQRIIDRYIGLKAEWYIESAISGKEKNRKLEKKRLGKITRLYMKEEMARQREYLKSPSLKPPEAVAIYKLSAEYFKSKKIRKISFPEKNEDRFLSIAIDRLKGTATSEESEFFDKALENSTETIFKIKKALLTQRTFKEVEVTLKGSSGSAIRSYSVSHMERLVDAFLCAYLFYESDKVNIFPEFIKPGDELDTKLLMNFCEKISEFDATEEELLLLYSGEYKNLMENIDNNLLSKLLKLILDPVLSDYIISRNNCQVFYKDMCYTNHLGFIRGFQFSPFVHKFYSFIVDLCVLGTDFFMDERSSVKYYVRHLDSLYVLFKFKREEIDILMDDYKGELEMIKNVKNEIRTNYFDNVTSETDGEEMISFISNDRSKVEERNMMIGNCIHIEMATRLLPSLGRIGFKGYCIFPKIKFSMCGVDVLISDKKLHERSSWSLRTGKYANLAVSKDGVDAFNDRIAHIVNTSGSATFLKVVNRWNTSILAFVAYYREFIPDTRGLMDNLSKAELLIHNVIKKGINSKMPVRFPPAMFYSPREVGGLGMLSMAGIKIPSEDLGKKEVDGAEDGATDFSNGCGGNRTIPLVVDYIERWDLEFEESDRVWMEYGRSGKVELDKGIPRMNTLLQKNKVMFYDRGFRMINLYKRYSSSKPDPFAFTSTKHDGRLWSMEKFTLDVLDVLGGIKNISNHTLFSATYFRSFSKVFWEDTVMEKYRSLTNAQRMGMSQIPNRRFILWWSPTINRGNVYVGYQVQLDLTGVFMHGKLPTLKVSFVQIFRGHLWKKIHESVAMDLCDVFKKYCDVRKMDVHSKKSYRFASSSADILLSGNFYVHKPSSILDSDDIEKRVEDGSMTREEYNSMDAVENCKSLWIDVQLRWGDYDKRDPHKYAKARFIECTTDPLTKYPTKNGFVVVLDLCYNTFSVYGNLNKELKSILKTAMEKIITDNITLHILRERLRKALQLYTSDVEVVSSSSELFSAGLLVDSKFLLKKQRLIFIFDPINGNLYFRSYEGENKKPRHIKSLAAQDIFSLGEMLNKRSVVVAEDMVDAMENFIIDHPSISIKSSSSSLPFFNVLKMKDITAKKTLESVDLYKGWNVTGKFTNFCRLLLIVQGLDIDENKVRELGICEIWPDFSDDEWIEKEIRLKDIIVGDYCFVNSINPNALSQNEVRDIVFGFKIHSDARERKDVVAKEGGIGKSNLALGDVSFGGNNTWRTRYMTLDARIRSGEYDRYITEVLSKATKAGIKDIEKLQASRSYESVNGESSENAVESLLWIPLNLIKQFVSLADPQALTCALIIHTTPISFALVPQFSSELEIHSTSFIPDNVEVIGIVVNSDRVDLIDILSKRYRIHNPWGIIICDDVRVVKKTDDWHKASFAADKSSGVFYIPEMWNYNFSKPFYDDESVYTLKIGTPSRFYDGFSRVGHFSRFWHNQEDEDYEVYY